MSVITRAASSNSIKTKLVIQPGGEIIFNRDGSVTATENYRCVYAIALSLAPRRYITPHPQYPALVCDDVHVTRLPGDAANIKVDYVGDPAAYYGGYASQPIPLYTLVVETGEEPIETWYKDGGTNFASIATTANGAAFAANGLFAGWLKTSPYVAITSYLKPRTLWRKESFQKTQPSQDVLALVGKIDTPEGNAPDYGGSYSWLLRSFDYQFQGAIYRYKKEWILSNPQGWNTTIYGP